MMLDIHAARLSTIDSHLSSLLFVVRVIKLCMYPGLFFLSMCHDPQSLMRFLSYYDGVNAVRSCAFSHVIAVCMRSFMCTVTWYAGVNCVNVHFRLGTLCLYFYDRSRYDAI